MAQENSSKKHDWGLFFSGIALILVSAVVILWPGLTLVTIAIVAGAILVVAGIFDFVFYFRAKDVTQPSGWVIVNGILDIILGAMFLIQPVATAAVLPWIAGVFIIAYGIVAIPSAIAFRKIGSAWPIMLLNGILSILIGIIFVMDPASFALFLGIYLAMRGVMMCIYGIIAPRNLPYM